MHLSIGSFFQISHSVLLLTCTTHLICIICPQKAVISLRAIIRLLDWVVIMIAVDYDEGRSSVLCLVAVCALLSEELKEHGRKTEMAKGRRRESVRQDAVTAVV